MATLEDLLEPAPSPAPGTRPPAPRPRPRSRRVRVLGLLAVIAFVLTAVAAGAWWVTGGRWMIVATPSMGQAAPVGTLVFTEKVSITDLRVGDIISFHSPVNPSETYTHRIISVNPDGTVQTRGDINGAMDPAPLHDKDLIGRVVARWWAVGWLIRALPFLLVGGLVLFAATRRWASARWLVPLRVFGSSLLLAIAAFLLKPFVGFVVVLNMPTLDGADATLVATGILPIRITPTGGSAVDFVDGQMATVRASGPPEPRGYQFSSAAHLSFWWWVFLIACWLTPLLIGILASRPDRPVTDHRVDPATGSGTGGAAINTADTDSTAGPESSAREQVQHSGQRSESAGAGPAGRHRMAPLGRPKRPGRARPRWVAGLVLSLAMTSVLIPSTASAFTARITNNTNTAASNPYFTCLASTAPPATPNPYFTWPLGDTTFVAAQDVSGNTRPGVYVGGSFANSTSKACSRDTTGSTVLSGAQSYIQSGAVSGVLTPITGPTTFSEEIWFKTTTNVGGRLIGFGNGTLLTALSGSYDRHIYMISTGQLIFGVYPNTVRTITSPGIYNDGLWHQVTATLSPTAGMVLYVDGAQVASDPTTTTAQSFSGNWRVGYDNLNGWTNTPSSYNFLGSLAYASVYTVVLSATQVLQHYAAGSGTPTR